MARERRFSNSGWPREFLCLFSPLLVACIDGKPPRIPDYRTDVQLIRPPRRTWIPVFFAALAATVSRPASAQPGAGDPPVTYEVQIDGESFQVEGSQRPIKVESKLKKGTTYTLAVRVAMTQTLRLNSVQMEYGMWAKVIDNKDKDLRMRKSFTSLDLASRSPIWAMPWT